MSFKRQRTVFKNQDQQDKYMVRRYHALTSTMASRMKLGSRLGESYGTDRKLYEALGYPTELSFRRLNGRYIRQDIAKRIVNAYPDATWRGKPAIQEDEESKETPWEESVKDLFKEIKAYHYLKRADRLSGIGRYGALLIGFDDGKDLKDPVEKAKEVLYLQPYTEENCIIKSLVTERTDRRFGLPELYEVTYQQELQQASVAQTEQVHWSRLIHIPSDDQGENDIYGKPRLEAVYNRLQDIELVSGGSAEQFWRGAFPGLNFKMDPEMQDIDEEDMEDQIEDYVHGLSRYFQMRGISIESLEPQIGKPKEQFEMEIDLVSAATGIPKRILMGSERGELASSQDKDNWNDRVTERREDFAEPTQLRPFIDRLILVGVLEEPSDDYTVVWPDLDALSDKEQADVANIRAEALQKYIRYPGADEVVPVRRFLMDFLNYDEKEVDAMQDEVAEMMEEERLDAEADAEAEREFQEAETKRQAAAGVPPVAVPPTRVKTVPAKKTPLRGRTNKKTTKKK